MLAVRDVAEIFKVTEKTVYRWVKQGAIPAYQIQDQYRFSRPELLEWAAAQRIQVSPLIFDEHESQGHHPATLSNSLSAGGIYYRVSASDRDSALRTASELVRLPDETDRSELYEALVRRENLASTATGGGVAIPHVKGPLIFPISQPCLALCFLEGAVNFAAPDGLPVNVLFVLVSPTVRSHLNILSRLAFALQDSDFKSLLANEAGRDEIVARLKQIDSAVSENRKQSRP